MVDIAEKRGVYWTGYRSTRAQRSELAGERNLCGL